MKTMQPREYWNAARLLLLAVLGSIATLAPAAESLPLLEQAERIVAVRDAGYFPVMIPLQDGALVRQVSQIPERVNGFETTAVRN